MEGGTISQLVYQCLDLRTVFTEYWNIFINGLLGELQIDKELIIQ